MEIIVNEKMIKESLVSRGNVSKIKSVMEKAHRGEDITVAFLGGSITQGCNATKHENCYANRTYLWFKDKFSNVNVTYINAGIGATGSIIGVHRVEDQVLSKNPDIVFVDFAVNDKENKYNKIAYESLIRRLLCHKSNPAIIEIFMSTDILENVQEQQVEIGNKYNIPMISFRDAIKDEINDGRLKWTDVASDEVHPNDNGHRIISELLINLLENIDNEKNINIVKNVEIGQPVFGENFIEGKIINRENIEVICEEGLIVDKEGFQGFKNGWMLDVNSNCSGKLKVELKGKNIFLLYKKLIKDNAVNFQVKIDEKYIKDINSYFEGGWGDYSETEMLIQGDKIEKHNIEILFDRTSQNKEIFIMGFLVS